DTPRIRRTGASRGPPPPPAPHPHRFPAPPPPGAAGNHPTQPRYPPVTAGTLIDMGLILLILGIVLIVAGVGALLRKQMLWGIVLFVIGLIVAPGGGFIGL